MCVGWGRTQGEEGGGSEGDGELGRVVRCVGMADCEMGERLCAGVGCA